jgi:hypothetical protein
VLQIPARRTRINAHLGRTFGSGFETCLSLPLLTWKASTSQSFLRRTADYLTGFSTLVE